MKRILIFAFIVCLASSCGPKGNLARPSKAQLAWQDMEMNMFCHFGPNTFTGREWGDGTETEDLFNPSDLDCRQWAATAKAAGFKGIIITAKHHDGFCLWPNPVSSHTVARSSWRGGKGDVLRELSEACREYGLKFGVYISPWDRNDPHYGTPEYNDVFVKTLESALGNYGPVFEQWFDGACGEGPNGKRQEYDWPLFNGTVARLQKDAVIFSNVGPGCRWVGNEEGSAGRTCWGTLNVDGFVPGDPLALDTLNQGNVRGEKWIPAETDVSIRPGWFWRESENGKVKSVQQLLRIYYESVGRNSLLLLNVPPDTTGQIHPLDSVRLMEFRSALDKIFAEDLAKGAKVSRDGMGGCRVEFVQPATFNRVVLEEDIAGGQKIAAFTIEALTSDGWKEIACETTVGHKRIVLTPVVTATELRIKITRSLEQGVRYKVPKVYMDSIYVDRPVVKAEGTVYPAGESLTADLGSVKVVKGFEYVPIYKGEGGVIETYRLDCSRDGRTWNTIYSERMFDNIVNNPVRQEVVFDVPISVRYLKLVPIRTNAGGNFGVSSFNCHE